VGIQTSVPSLGRGDAQPFAAGGAGEAAGQDPQPSPSALGTRVGPGERGHRPEGPGEECQEWSTHLPSPTSPPQSAHQRFPLAGIFSCGVKLKFCCRLPASVLFTNKSAKPALVGLDRSARCLSRLSLLQLATEMVESKSLGSSKSLKKCHVYVCILLPLFTFFLRDKHTTL